MAADLSMWELICLGTEPIDLLEVMGLTIEEWRAIVGTPEQRREFENA